MPLNLNENHTIVSGETEDNCRYIQNGARYKANGDLCEGSSEPVPEGELPFTELLDTDILTKGKKPYSTIEGAEKRLIDDPELDSSYVVARVGEEEYVLRKVD